VGEIFEEDPESNVREKGKAMAVWRERRDAIIELFKFRRPNGEPLTDVAIAVRVGCKPSEVAEIRRSCQQGEAK